ncbi:MAG: PIN domain-containing protein [Gemmataceae bacterium]
MPDRFVDTSGWAAWISPTERLHPIAVAAVDDTWAGGGRLVTTSFVLAELTGLLNRLRVPKPQQIETLDAIRSDPAVVAVSVAGPLEAAAWALWAARPDKEWTVVDCASFIAMQERRLTESLTTDHHFEQAGFVRLLR